MFQNRQSGLAPYRYVLPMEKLRELNLSLSSHLESPLAGVGHVPLHSQYWTHLQFGLIEARSPTSAPPALL
ncbi:hypothetical protein HZ326_18841 [Fusarium oxysporum f. sp. albedinis]|nr:Aurofusarin biosynthesis cluster protein S [Fusarium oxysporum f. sp. albedinis]KAJ0138211.1 hypothetical protein HZ326_18841 [Fusarium oxysporum f. sp. albedinis]